MDPKAHWNAAWGSRPSETASWYQLNPEPSLRLVQAISNAGNSVMDVGGGASGLAGALVAAGYLDVTVLDISGAALVELRKRLGLRAPRVRTVEADVLEYRFPLDGVVVWHDRAVFHFLTESSDRARYRKQLGLAVATGGYAIIGTFAPDGPTRCSGLPVERYDSAALIAELGDGWERVLAERHEHSTPSGSLQPFTFVVARRVVLPETA